jgi:antirestriction protein ArdC
VKRFFFLLNAALAMAILDLISHVHLASFVSSYWMTLRKREGTGN